MPLEFFLRVAQPCSRNLKGPLNLVLYVSENIRTVQHTEQIIRKEKWKKLDFWKIQSQNGVVELSKNAVKTPFLDSKLWLHTPLEFFLCVAQPCLRYLKGPPNLVLYVSEKIRTVQHTKQILRKEKCKKLDFKKSSLKMGLASSQKMLWKPHFGAQNFFLKGL